MNVGRRADEEEAVGVMTNECGGGDSAGDESEEEGYPGGTGWREGKFQLL